MKQLLQDLRSHEVVVEEVPPPSCLPDGVLVKSAASLISSGTERATISLGGRSLLGKAFERPDLMRQVFRRKDSRRDRCDRHGALALRLIHSSRLQLGRRGPRGWGWHK